MEVSQLTDQRPACHVLEMNWDPTGTRVLWGVWGAPSLESQGMWARVCTSTQPRSVFLGFPRSCPGRLFPPTEVGASPSPTCTPTGSSRLVREGPEGTWGSCVVPGERSQLWSGRMDLVWP